MPKLGFALAALAVGALTATTVAAQQSDTTSPSKAASPTTTSPTPASPAAASPKHASPTAAPAPAAKSTPEAKTPAEAQAASEAKTTPEAKTSPQSKAASDTSAREPKAGSETEPSSRAGSAMRMRRDDDDDNDRPDNRWRETYRDSSDWWEPLPREFNDDARDYRDARGWRDYGPMARGGRGYEGGYEGDYQDGPRRGEAWRDRHVPGYWDEPRSTTRDSGGDHAAMMMGGMTRRLCGPGGGKMMSRMVTRLEHITQPTEAQQPVFDRLKEAVTKAREMLQGACPTGPAPITPPGRLAAAEKHLTTVLEAVRLVRPILDEYYGSLSEEQKARLYATRRDPGASYRQQEEQDKRGQPDSSDDDDDDTASQRAPAGSSSDRYGSRDRR